MDLKLEEEYWNYNLKDCVYTREVGEVEQKTIENLTATTWPKCSEIHQFQQELFWPVLWAMNTGVRVLAENKNLLAGEIQTELSRREAFIFDLLGHEINPRSSSQMTKLFYEDLRQPPIMTRATKNAPAHLTCDDEALQKIVAREPLLKPLVNSISDIRTLGIFQNFVLMGLDIDGRARCSFNIGGSTSGKSAPYSYRLSSSKNPWDGGANLQTIPSDKSKSVGKAAARGQTIGLPEFHLPNIRSMFGPDPGFTFFDMDLDRADLQVVVWESNDEMLKAALHLGADIHTLNAFVLEGKDPPPLEELVETHPKYLDHRGPRKHLREFAKVFCHATNYVGGARTIAAHTGRTVHEIDRAQGIWFGAHPGIKTWHNSVQEQITKRRFVENKFGYRWYIFDRIEGLLPEACAWVPQSTVGCTINRIWMNLWKNHRELVQVLLQVHDSLAGQFPTHKREAALAALKEASRVVIPYDDPLIIPTGIKTSELSWGGCV